LRLSGLAMLEEAILLFCILVRWPLKALIDAAHTASCGREFHLEIALSVKK